MLEPLGPRVLVEVLRRADITEGGLIRPDAADDRPLRGRVLSAGEEVSAVGEGDIVLFGRYAGVQVDTDGDHEHYLLRTEELLARVTPEDDWTLCVVVDGEPIELGPLRDCTVVAEASRFVIGGVVEPPADDVRRRIASAGYVEASIERGTETRTVWRAASASLVRSDGRVLAQGEPDADHPEAPLGIFFEGGTVTHHVGVTSDP